MTPKWNAKFIHCRGLNFAFERKKALESVEKHTFLPRQQEFKRMLLSNSWKINCPLKIPKQRLVLLVQNLLSKTKSPIKQKNIKWLNLPNNIENGIPMPATLHISVSRNLRESTVFFDVDLHRRDSAPIGYCHGSKRKVICRKLLISMIDSRSQMKAGTCSFYLQSSEFSLSKYIVGYGFLQWKLANCTSSLDESTINFATRNTSFQPASVFFNFSYPGLGRQHLPTWILLYLWYVELSNILKCFRSTELLGQTTRFLIQVSQISVIENYLFCAI